MCFTSPKVYYHKSYFEIADNILGEITKRFDQKNYVHPIFKSRVLLLKVAGVGEVLPKNLEDVTKHSGDDLDRSRLQNQLTVLSGVARDIEHSLLSFQSTSSHFSEVLRLLQVLYVLPTSTAIAEQSSPHSVA